ncbi:MULTISPECIES: Ig-like domain-containing protein [unclassified Methylocaldum]|uniref:Ig-like domain-containing protein n=1 Tax=unclassified Methylocaldum TaxID=2622260 RepID=UPI000989A894|nr:MULTISPECIES: Ig-like domain-containing protein [unclassified Methylocaldum]MBP1152244.1 subtilisin family serine protease [Methylocaldum sp. RMAD-M]MVF24837.1 tandem-95 repeat protein [Methylocaldum sp. BRCS4]
MRVSNLRRPVNRTVSILLLATFAGPVTHAGAIDPRLDAVLRTAKPNESIAVIVTLSDRVELGDFKDKDKRLRRSKITKALKAKANQSQKSLKAFLQSQGAQRVRQLWLINGMSFAAKGRAVLEVARRPEVERMSLDQTLEAPTASAGTQAAPEWNLNVIHVPELWAMQHTGRGIVVANMDTGVDANHPDLGSRWRGGANSWYDPHGEHATPYDGHGHGTQTMGIMVGGSAGGTAIGVAPGAEWIAAKLFDDAGQAQFSDIHLSFQWLLDPDGNPDTSDAPDVVAASWGLQGTTDRCVLEFANDIQVFREAGIGLVFSAGNEGPISSSSVSPANNPEAFSSGAVDDTSVVANFSSRGASACDGGIYPQLSAPGVDVNTSDLSFGGLPIYATVSGTSYAAAHAAGTMALLLEAFPNTGIAVLESTLRQSAQDLGESGADNSYGYGLIDAKAAHDYLLDHPPGGGHAPAITSTPVTTATQGQRYTYTVTASDPDGDTLIFSLDSAPTGMSIDGGTGLISWIPNADQVGANNVTVKVADFGGLSTTQTFTINVADVNDPPVASNDAYSTVEGGTLSIAAPGVLGNDSDPDGDSLNAVLAGGVAHGSLNLNANGSFSYTPAVGFTGTDGFTYRANDGTSSSTPATVSITVAANKPPVAANDSATTRRNTGKLIAVLANDSDPDGSLDPATVTISAKPDKGGSAVANGDGTITYRPRLRFTGTEVFRYTVNDNRGAESNAATVTVNVTR